MSEGPSEQGRVVGRISTRAAAWLARLVCAASLLLLATSLLIVIVGWSAPLPEGWRWEEQATIALVILGAPVVGGFVASNRPGNPYGWLWLGFGLGLALSSFGQNYVIYSAWVRPGALPAPGAILLAAGTGWAVAMAILPFLLLLFPDGRLPSPRWRIVAWVAAVAGGVTLPLGMFRPDQRLGPIESPLAADGAVGEAIIPVTNVGLFVVLAAIIPGALSLVFRYRYAAGTERQQIKWFAYAAAVQALVFVVSLVVDDLLDVAASLPDMVWVAFNNVPFVIVYVAIGVAVLKYRLYDIDVVINRTLVYGSLTGILALVYFGGVTATQAVLQAFTDQERLPQLVIVASTLAIAALFNPLRRRVQSFVDRRFYRRKYDAARTLAAFNARLRDETELETLSGDVVSVVKETMQPAHVGLWLQPDREAKGGRGGET